jgi:hypothetical protein
VRKGLAHRAPFALIMAAAPSRANCSSEGASLATPARCPERARINPASTRSLLFASVGAAVARTLAIPGRPRRSTTLAPCCRAHPPSPAAALRSRAVARELHHVITHCRSGLSPIIDSAFRGAASVFPFDTPIQPGVRLHTTVSPVQWDREPDRSRGAPGHRTRPQKSGCCSPGRERKACSTTARPSQISRAGSAARRRATPAAPEWRRLEARRLDA